MQRQDPATVLRELGHRVAGVPVEQHHTEQHCGVPHHASVRFPRGADRLVLHVPGEDMSGLHGEQEEVHADMCAPSHLHAHLHVHRHL